MKKEIGLWIDHSKAIIVTLVAEGQEVEEIVSNMERRVRFASGNSEDGSAEDVRDRQYSNHLNIFYSTVIGLIRDGTSIQIFGPGEAKGELQKRLQKDGLGANIFCVEPADKMTVRQISAKVRASFRNHSP